MKSLKVIPAFFVLLFTTTAQVNAQEIINEGKGLEPKLSMLDSIKRNLSSLEYEDSYIVYDSIVGIPSIASNTYDQSRFNQGIINSPMSLIQGRALGTQIYNRGGNPNTHPIYRMRGLNSLYHKQRPLIVVDGIPDVDLESVDPNDIEDIQLLRSVSATSIYGVRGASGVILINTKKSKVKDNSSKISYRGQYGVGIKHDNISIMDAEEFVASGGHDLGSSTDWNEEITRMGVQHTHNLSIEGAAAKTRYRMSGNYRNIEGILKNTGFEKVALRLNTETMALNDKLSLSLNSSFIKRNSDKGFLEAFRYANSYNPTAPVFAEDANVNLSSEQFGGYFESLGLFDSYNPVSIIEQNKLNNETTLMYLGGQLKYHIVKDFYVHTDITYQDVRSEEIGYYPPTSHFRGFATSPTRKGLAEFYNYSGSNSLFQLYGNYRKNIGSKTSVRLTGGYAFQRRNDRNRDFSLGDFPSVDIDFTNVIQVAEDLFDSGLVTASSSKELDELISFFGMGQFLFHDKFSITSSVRREKSSQFGANIDWALYYSASMGIDINSLLLNDKLKRFDVRVGYGLAGSLPGSINFARRQNQFIYAGDGSVTTITTKLANDELKWNESKELNIGTSVAKGLFHLSLDWYNKRATRLIDQITIVEATSPNINLNYGDAGSIVNQGLEINLELDLISNLDHSYTTGVYFSTYNSKIDSYYFSAYTLGELGGPGSPGNNFYRIIEGNSVGEIWGPVFDGVDENGFQKFKDLNEDGVINLFDNGNLDELDIQVLGKGLPSFELGWSHSWKYKSWSANLFLRGAFGHSLVNSNRVFYESMPISFDYYNNVNTDKAVAGLMSNRLSSLYVEKADFVKIDNVSITKRIGTASNASIRNINLTLAAQNLLTVTGYSGADPEPVLIDYGPLDNGARPSGNGQLLSPGVDRRNYYLPSRIISLSLQFDL